MILVCRGLLTKYRSNNEELIIDLRELFHVIRKDINNPCQIYLQNIQDALRIMCGPVAICNIVIINNTNKL